MRERVADLFHLGDRFVPGIVPGLLELVKLGHRQLGLGAQLDHFGFVSVAGILLGLVGLGLQLIHLLVELVELVLGLGNVFVAGFGHGLLS